MNSDYNSCPLCGELLIEIDSERIKATHHSNHNDNINMMGKNGVSSPDLEIVKGTVLWNLNPGEIARRISINEFNHLADVKGVYVQEGVKAVLMIDGAIVTYLSSGVYYFDTRIERLTGALANIARFFTGKKREGSDDNDAPSRGRLGSYLQKLGSVKNIEVVLVTSGFIPVVFGVAGSDTGLVFSPFVIKTQLDDVEVGISMYLKITDVLEFTRQYLTGKDFFSIASLQIRCKDAVYNTVQEVMAHETIDSVVISPALKDRLKKRIAEKLDSILPGMAVEQVIDITAESADFERFRELEHKLRNSNAELDYLIRTNDFKNRLATEENSQQIREARTEEDLRHKLQQLNKDKLLHDDEVEEFCQLLANQKALREARTDEERDKALQEIKKNRLIREDEFESLQADLKKNRQQRTETDLILHWQSYKKTERERVLAEKEIALLTTQSAQELEDAGFELNKRQLEHEIHLKEKTREFAERMDEAERVKMVRDKEAEVEADSIEHKHDLGKGYDYANLDDYQQTLEMERINAQREKALDAYDRLERIKRENKAQDIEHAADLAKLEHERYIKMLEEQTKMTAEQIAATKLAELSPMAQQAFMEALSKSGAGRGDEVQSGEWFKLMSDVIARMGEQENVMSRTQNETYDKLLDFAREALKTNAGIATASVTGSQGERQQVVSEFPDAPKNDTRHATLFEVFNRSYGIDQIYSMIDKGAIQPTTGIRVDGKTYEAYAVPELKAALEQKYHVECKQCGRKGFKGEICENCQNVI